MKLTILPLATGIRTSAPVTDIHEVETYRCEFNCQCYVGRPDNPSFRMPFSINAPTLFSAKIGTLVGSEPIDKLAERIWHSVGPSGPNKVRVVVQPPSDIRDGT